MTSSFASPLRVLALVSVFLLGWLVVYVLQGWFSDAEPPAISRTSQESDSGSAAMAPASRPVRGERGTADDSDTLARLTEKQAAMAEEVARLRSDMSGQLSPPVPASAAAPGASTPERQESAADADGAAARRAAIQRLQAVALERLGRLEPGDTEAMIAAMEDFVLGMRDAGAPDIIDLDNFRDTLRHLDELQRVGRQLQKETSKGRNADAAVTQALNRRLQALSARTLPSFIDQEDIRRLLESG